MSTDTIGDETEDLTFLDWCTAIGFLLITICWLGFLGLLALSALVWIVSL